MWSAIGRATARQVRVASRLSAQLAPRTAPVVPSGIRVAAVFARGLAQAGRPRKTSTETTSAAPKKKAAAKKPATKKKATAKKAGTKKAAAKAKAPAAKKTKPKARKAKKVVLTDEQKARLEIRELKKTALIKEEPTKLPTTLWMMYTAQRTKELAKEGPNFRIGKAAVQISTEYKALPAAEIERLNALCEQNKVANEVNLKNFIDSYTAHQIRAANLARQQLRRKHNIRTKPTFDDPRYPQSPVTPFVAYLKTRLHAPEMEGLEAKHKFSKAAEEWKQLSPEERQPFRDIFVTDSSRYNKEMEAFRQQAERK